jgi:uncharacterized protein (DUF2164 family)
MPDIVWYRIILFLFLLGFEISNAQELRVTFDIPAESNLFKIIPLDTVGFISIHEKQARVANAKNIRLTISKFDTNMVLDWQTEKVIMGQLYYNKSYRDGAYTYILLNNDYEFSILKIENATGEIENFTGKLPKEKVKINHFLVKKNMAFMGGFSIPPDGAVLSRTCLAIAFFPLFFVPNFIPQRGAALLSYSLSIKTLKKYQPRINGESEITQLTFDSIHQKINFIAVSKKNNYKTLYYYETPIFEGVVRFTAINPITDEFELKNVLVYTRHAKSKMFVGLYSKTTASSDMNKGIFVTDLTPDVQKFIQYNSFTKFKSAFNHLPEAERERLKAKLEKKLEKNSDLDINYYCIMHEPIILDTNFFITAVEFFEPKYHTEYRTTWYYGRPIDTPIEVFDGYRFSHFIISKMDYKGQIYWDYNYPIQGIQTFEYAPRLSISTYNNKIMANYSNLNRIVSHTIGDDSTSNTKTYKIFDSSDTDKEKVDYYISSNIQNWYKDYYLFYGKQKITSYSDDFYTKKGFIFFINKYKI